MGDIAEMMLDGTLCEGCGVHLEGDYDGEPWGFPRLCNGCADEREKAGHEIDRLPLAGNVDCGMKEVTECPDCGKKLKTHAGMIQHYKDKHG